MQKRGGVVVGGGRLEFRERNSFVSLCAAPSPAEAAGSSLLQSKLRWGKEGEGPAPAPPQGKQPSGKRWGEGREEQLFTVQQLSEQVGPPKPALNRHRAASLEVLPPGLRPRRVREVCRLVCLFLPFKTEP